MEFISAALFFSRKFFGYIFNIVKNVIIYLELFRYNIHIYREDGMFKVTHLKIIFAFIFIAILISTSKAAEENEAFEICGKKIPAGEMMSIKVKVEVEEDNDCFIPITVINGKHKGKVLALAAGVHGFEYPPILALYRLKDKIDPEELSGTIIMVHIANLPGFQKRIIYYNPYDWKNLNRVFPGDPNGTQAERIAYVLIEEIVKKCDGLIDLHCGDGNEALIPYTYWMISDDENMNEVTQQMALAFGIKHIIIDNSRVKDIKQSKYLGNTAILLSKPAITTESGYLGNIDEESTLRNIRGIMNVMKLFKMIPGEPDMPEFAVWIDKYEVVYSEYDGLFFPLTEMGYYVKEGEPIGYITDYFGKKLKTYTAPFTGILLYIIYTPPANKGEPLFEVGHISE